MTDIDKTKSPEMFNKIAGRYDVINRILSFGLDIIWRRRVVKMAKKESPERILDLATGTGDLLIALTKELSSAHVIGLDPSEGMLAFAKQKIEKQHLEHRAELVKGDALALPFTDNDFDLVTMAFGIRNVPDVSKALSEIYRVLKPNGRVMILEFSLPKNRFIRAVNLFYLRSVIPVVGGLLSRNMRAYKYLNKTIEQFPYGELFIKLLESAGFVEAKFHPLTFGAVMIYEARKD